MAAWGILPREGGNHEGHSFDDRRAWPRVRFPAVTEAAQTDPEVIIQRFPGVLPSLRCSLLPAYVFGWRALCPKVQNEDFYASVQIFVRANPSRVISLLA